MILDYTGFKFRVDNLLYRWSQHHPGCAINIGVGNYAPDIVVVQAHTKMPERDSITGALKKFGMLDSSYRATIEIASDARPEQNRYYLRELIQVLNPQIVVACGPQAMSVVRNKKVRSFKKYSGDTFSVDDLPGITCYATIDPMEYGYHRASRSLKNQGRKEWSNLNKIYKEIKEKQKLEPNST